MVLAPEHPLVAKIDHAGAASRGGCLHQLQATRQTDIQREATDKEKTGVFTGGYAINPVNGERIPIWIADYVLMTYGTGAIMAVPAHDQRDFEFARKFGLEVRVVIQPEGKPAIDADEMTAAVPAYGAMVNSGPLTGTPGDQAFDRAIELPGRTGAGQAASQLPPARLVDLAPALLGCAHPDGVLRELRRGAGAGRSAAGAAAG